MEQEKPGCKVNGMLHGGRAMCGYVMVGLKKCGLKGATCEYQVVSSPQPSIHEAKPNEQKPLDPVSIMETLQREEFIERDVL